MRSLRIGLRLAPFFHLKITPQLSEARVGVTAGGFQAARDNRKSIPVFALPGYIQPIWKTSLYLLDLFQSIGGGGQCATQQACGNIHNWDNLVVGHPCRSNYPHSSDDLSVVVIGGRYHTTVVQ